MCTLKSSLVPVAVLAALVGSAVALAQPEKDKGKTGDTKAAQPAGDEAAMMQKWIDAGTPGEHHKILASMVGTWNARSTMWMAPGAPGESSDATMTNTMIMDGRYLRGEYKGNWGGQDFTGEATTAYDNTTKTWKGTWIDSMSTDIGFSEGKSADNKTITFKMTHSDPMTGGTSEAREVLTIDGPDKHTMTFYKTGPDGKEFKSMEIVYTRRK